MRAKTLNHARGARAREGADAASRRATTTEEDETVMRLWAFAWARVRADATRDARERPRKD